MSSPHVRPRKIKIDSYTSVLYGVFVTEKSYLLGIKRLVQREHVGMLVRKVAGHRLPPELIEMLMEHVLDSQESMLQKVWMSTTASAASSNGMDTYNRWRIMIGRLNPAERAVQQRLSRLGVSATRVEITRPGYPSDRFDAGEAVSADAIRHSTYYDDTTLASPDEYSSKDYIMTCGSKIGIQASQCFTVLEPGYNADGLMPICMQAASDASVMEIPCRIPNADEVTDPDKLHSRGLQRMIQIDGVEDAMQNWNAYHLERAFDLLKLQIVPFKEGDPMEPGLYIAPDVTVMYQ